MSKSYLCLTARNSVVIFQVKITIKLLLNYFFEIYQAYMKMNRQKQVKDPNLCSCEGCQNFRMEISKVCSICYQKISNEMAETVNNKQQLKPAITTERDTFIEFTKAINNTQE